MAYYAETKTTTKSQEYPETDFDYKYKKDYTSDLDVHQNYTLSFDAYEAMVIGQVYDQVSNSVDGSKITDSYATTLAKERADRVMAKLPDGETSPVGRADVGKAAFMDILRQKWVYPNANAQHPFAEKLNMWQFYSSVYGYMVMFYDWNVSSTGYVGPDCWLWNPRNLIPQQGRISISDMDYVTAQTWVGRKFLQKILDGKASKTQDDGWNRDAIRELLSRDLSKKTDYDSQKDTKVARDRSPGGVKRGIMLATRYEAGTDGKWCVFAPEHGFLQLREIANPHKNGRIPFVIKYSQPLFDSFYGLGDFQRAKPLQFARDGLTNFYFKGIKMNLIPPIIANANSVMRHTLDYREGAVMLETIPNSIRRLETSTAGLATYKDAMSNLTGSLLSLFGSQNASIPGAETLNPSQGKTPAAIDLYSDKEATRDGSERRHLEAAIEQLTDGFFSLIANIGTQDIPITLFSDDLEDIRKSGLTDIEGLFKGKLKPDVSMAAADLKINPSSLKGIEYRFNIKPDSTAKINKQAQQQAIEGMMDRLGKFQNVFQDDPRIDIQWGKILEAWENLVDIPGAREFIKFDENAPSKQDLEMQKAQQEQEAQAKAAQQPSPNAVTMPGGQVHESADLVKLYTVVEDLEGKNAIREALGLPPLQVLPPPEGGIAGPTPSQSGHIFNDPNTAAAADAIHALIPPTEAPPMPSPEQPQPPVEPTSIDSGHAFVDPTVGAAAQAIHTATEPAPPQPAK